LESNKHPSTFKKLYTCNYCGKRFEEYVRSYRKYCSRKCANNARRHGDCYAKPGNIPPGAKEKNKAIKLHQTEGLTAYAIAQEMKVNPANVLKWIKREEKRKENPESPCWLTESHFRFASVNNVADWRKILRDEMKNSGFEYARVITTAVPVRLICKIINLHKGVDYFVTVVSEKLGLDPFDGGYFAFCGYGRENMRFLRWDGSGFQMTCRRREEGLYIWPPERLGSVVEVSAREFEFIVRGSNARKTVEKVTGKSD